MNVTRKLCKIMQRPQRRSRNAFKEYLSSIVPAFERGQHLGLRSIAHPWGVARPYRVGLTTIGDERNDVDQAALLNGERQDVAIEPQIHLRNVDQVLVDATCAVGFAQLLAVDQPAVGTGAAESWRSQGLVQALQYMVADR
ncbi:hypothetical protein D3C80_392300 [compost metagenome]